MRNKVLYAIPTMRCNLKCDHCFIANAPETFNRDKFLDEINNFEGTILLFGGEVTFNKSRMFDIINDNKKNGKCKISHLSTNLLILDTEILDFYESLGSISTSWNPHRFSIDQYEIWKNNCKLLSNRGIYYRVMITLTEDLFEMSAKEFLKMADTWITKELVELKFEHYVGDVTKDYFDRADNWLCELYKEWNIDTDFEILTRTQCWHHNCNEIYTLYPDGRLTNRCPHDQCSLMPSECFTCELADTCQPCRLQPYCSYPKKLAKLIKDGKEMRV